ncbi:hypothetical protein RIF29_15781 [Crotalaria pallida]|uniref:Uncharacterized protein n=1 Tax=Crotalaria pallida TaxID=3830 RepID=A0AAN9FFJ6_CROPI
MEEITKTLLEVEIRIRMEGEIENLIKVWLQAIISLCYYNAIGKIVPKAFVALIRAYTYLDNNLHPMVTYNAYCLHIYLVLEVILFIVALLAQTLLGFELEPHFDEPYLASSLQYFWGRRWNLVVVNIL